MSVVDIAKKIVPKRLKRKLKLVLIERKIKKKIDDKNKKSYKPGMYPEGVNLLGNIRAEIGLGQSCRLLANEIVNSGMPFSIMDYVMNSDEFKSNDRSYESLIGNDNPYDINIIHMEPPELIWCFINRDTSLFENKYNIGFWLWELEELPKTWLRALDIVDEVWTPSDFTTNTIKKYTDKPVITVPYFVTAECDDAFDRKHFKLPEDKFLFLVMYDSNSTIIRKNPIGAINAYRKAFETEREDVGIVIKVNNAKEEDLCRIRESLDGYKNVYYITDTLTKTEVNSLIKSVNVFVSLHRAEGFGLVMAEAMLNGTPCIATDWSSNTEFMNRESSCMVSYRFIEVEEEMGAYEKGMKWADADIDETAEYMKRLVTDRAYYGSLSRGAKEYITNKLDLKEICEKIRTRIGQIREERK